MEVPSPSKFRVSVIIPVLNDFERLGACLSALAAQTWPTDRLEVIIIDNGSDADIRPVLEGYPFVTLCHESRPGSYAARNTGLERATGNVVAFTDSDCLPEPQWIEQGVSAVERLGPKVVVGGRVVLFAQDGEHLTLAEEFELALGFSQKLYVEEKNYSVTANLFTTPHTLALVGRFNAELKSGGDKEWGQRAHSRGVPLHYAENAVVRHPARRSMSQLFQKRARLVGGHLGLARTKHSDWVAFGLVLAKACLPPLRRVRRAGQTLGGSPRRRPLRRQARVLLVGVSLQAYSVLELLRLQLGGGLSRR